MTFHQVFHQAEDELRLPQSCQRCGLELMSQLQIPFTPGQIVLDTWSTALEPPQLVRRQPIDPFHIPAGASPCTEVEIHSS